MFGKKNLGATLFFFVGQVARLTTNASLFIAQGSSFSSPDSFVGLQEGSLSGLASSKMKIINEKGNFLSMFILLAPREVSGCREPQYSRCTFNCYYLFDSPYALRECLRQCRLAYCQ